MDYIQDPNAIEKRSMEIIAPYLSEFSLSEREKKVYSRIIHASGDVEYRHIIQIHSGAIEAGMKAIQTGKQVYCDVEMVRTGINKKRLAQHSGEVFCRIGDPEVAQSAVKEGITRSMAAMRSFSDSMDGCIVAIGNAPTALFELLQLIREKKVRPALIIGVPVGFVGAKESKDLLVEESPVPYITVLGNKGGSPIAAAAFNALLYMIEE